MLVGPHDGGVDDQILEVWILAQRRKDALPHTACAPAVEAHEHAIPLAKDRWQIAPGRAGPRDPQHRLDEHPIVRARATWVFRLADAKFLDARPLSGA